MQPAPPGRVLPPHKPRLLPRPQSQRELSGRCKIQIAACRRPGYAEVSTLHESARGEKQNRPQCASGRGIAAAWAGGEGQAWSPRGAPGASSRAQGNRHRHCFRGPMAVRHRVPSRYPLTLLLTSPHADIPSCSPALLGSLLLIITSRGQKGGPQRYTHSLTPRTCE